MHMYLLAFHRTLYEAQFSAQGYSLKVNYSPNMCVVLGNSLKKNKSNFIEHIHIH